MKKKIRFSAILASLTLLTGCGALNTNSADFAEKQSGTAAGTVASDVPDCCEGGTNDC